MTQGTHKRAPKHHEVSGNTCEKLLRADGRLAVVGSRSTHARSSVRSTSTSGLSFDAMTGGTNWRVCAAQEELARQLFRLSIHLDLFADKRAEGAVPPPLMTGELYPTPSPACGRV